MKACLKLPVRSSVPWVQDCWLAVAPPQFVQEVICSVNVTMIEPVGLIIMCDAYLPSPKRLEVAQLALHDLQM